MAGQNADKVRQGLDRARELHERGRGLIDDWERLRAGECRRCHREAGTMRTLCKECAQRRRVVRSDYRRAARDRRSAEVTGIEQWLDLHRWVATQRFTLAEIAGDNNEYAEAWLADLARVMIQRGEVGVRDVERFEAAAAVLPLTEPTVAGLRTRLERARWFSALEYGEFPSVPTTLPLGAGERCHLDVRATQLWSAGGTHSQAVRLVVTNQRVLVVGPRGSHGFPLAQIAQVYRRGGIVVASATHTLGDQILVDDPEWAVALITAVLRSYRGELRQRPAPDPQPQQPVSAFVAAANALRQADREPDAAVVELVAGRWAQLPPEQQVRAERAAEAITGTFDVLHQLPQEVRDRPRPGGPSPAADATEAVDNAMLALSEIVLSDQRQYADQLAAMRNYTQQWRAADDPLHLD